MKKLNINIRFEQSALTELEIDSLRDTIIRKLGKIGISNPIIIIGRE